jgi:hypothetical protein
VKNTKRHAFKLWLINELRLRGARLSDDCSYEQIATELAPRLKAPRKRALNGDSVRTDAAA